MITLTFGESGHVCLEMPEPTGDMVKKELLTLRDRYETNWHGVAAILGMPPTSTSTRNMRRWHNGGETSSTIPRVTWRSLLVLNGAHTEVIDKR